MNRERELERLASELELYRARLASMLRRMGAEPRHIDDLVQNTMITASQNLHRYQDRDRMFSWLCRIASRHFFNHLRKREEWEAQLDDGYDPPGEVEEPFSAFHEAVRDCISELSRGEQAILRASIDCNRYDLAAIFSTTVGAITTRLSRIRATIRDCVQGKDFPLEDFK